MKYVFVDFVSKAMGCLENLSILPQSTDAAYSKWGGRSAQRQENSGTSGCLVTHTQSRRRGYFGRHSPNQLRRSARISVLQAPIVVEDASSTQHLSIACRTRSGKVGRRQDRRRKNRRTRDSLQSLARLSRSREGRGSKARRVTLDPNCNDKSGAKQGRKRKSSSGCGDNRNPKRKTKRTVVKNKEKQEQFRLSFDSSSEIVLRIPPYDERHLGNVDQVPEYASQIFQTLYAAEERYCSEPWTGGSQYLTSDDRSEVVGKLMLATYMFDCEPTVLFETMQILDRYCSRASLDRTEFILATGAALLLASKFSEVTPMEVDEIGGFMLFGFKKNFCKRAIVDCETKILRSLDYRFSNVTSQVFLHRFLCMTSANERTKERAAFFLDCSLFSEDLLDYRPSAVAAAVACMSIDHRGGKKSNPKKMKREILEYTQFPVSVIDEIVELLQASIQIPDPEQDKKLQRIAKNFGIEDTHPTQKKEYFIEEAQFENFRDLCSGIKEQGIDFGYAAWITRRRHWQ